MIDSNGDERIGEKMVDIIFYHRVKDSYNWHKKYIEPRLPPSYHMYSMVGFNKSKVII